KAFGLFGLGYRAISDASILSIKRMTLKAMSLLGVYRTSGVRIFKSILARGNQPKVGSINAVSVLTNMVNHHAVGYIAIFRVIGNSMRPSVLLSKVKHTIPISIEWPLPKFTTINVFPLSIETILLSYCKVVHVAHD